MSIIVILIVFACILGAVIIYNMGILSFTEKNYQFATLKVLGFSNAIGDIYDFDTYIKPILYILSSIGHL